MRIFIVDPSLFTLPYDSHLCNGLAENGNEVTLYGRSLRAGERITHSSFRFVPFFYALSERIDPGAKYTRTTRALIKAFEHCFYALRFIGEVSLEKPDIVHYQWMPFPAIDRFVVSRIRKKGISVFFTVHDTDPFNEAPTLKEQKIGWRKTLNVFNTLFVHTDFSRRTLEHIGIIPKNVVIIPHGLLTFGYTVNQPDSYLLENGKRVLFFGTIKPYKGLDILLRAFARMNAGPNVQLSVIGSAQNDDSEHYRSLAQELGISAMVNFDIRFFDDAEIPEMFAGADIIVFPYRRIDGSGALLTAIAYARPFIASDIGLFHELLGEHPMFLVPPDNPEALAERMKGALNDPALLLKMIEESKAIRNGIPSWKNIGARIIATYKDHIQK